MRSSWSRLAAVACGWTLLAGAVHAAPDVGGADPGSATERPVSNVRLASLPSGGVGRAVEPFGLSGREDAGRAFADRWTGTVRDIATDRAALARCRTTPETCTPAATRFLAIVEDARGKSGRARLGELNRAVNLAITYTSDTIRRRSPDMWTSPLATFGTGRGDCKDYAIAKYVALLEMGVAADDLRFVVVSEPKRAGELHAVLTVRQEGEWLVLDNRRLTLLPPEQLAEYRGVAALGTDLDTVLAQLTLPPLRGSLDGAAEG